LSVFFYQTRRPLHLGAIHISVHPQTKFVQGAIGQIYFKFCSSQ